jgi:hypothetical protein
MRIDPTAAPKVRASTSWCVVLLCAGLAIGGSGSAGSDTDLLERDASESYRVQVQLADGELRRLVIPKFPVEIGLTGSDGRAYVFRQPVDLYTETRRYLPQDQLGAAYESAYAALVANGDCLPIYAAVNEASFDCGERDGLRTVALRSDALGPHLSVEMIADALIPDHAAFDAARTVLDELTQEIESKAALRPPPPAAPSP